MKRILCAILSFTLMLALAACADTGKDWQAQYDLGIRYLEDGDYEEAILAFSAAIKIDGSRPEAYVGRADAYVATGETDKALKDYKKAKKIAERSEENYEDLIEDLDEIIVDLEEIVEESTGGMEETLPSGGDTPALSGSGKRLIQMTRTYQETNEISTTTFTYDESGRLIAVGSRTFVYDEENRLIQIWLDNSTVSDWLYIEYHYNENGFLTEISGIGEGGGIGGVFENDAQGRPIQYVKEGDWGRNITVYTYSEDGRIVYGAETHTIDNNVDEYSTYNAQLVYTYDEDGRLLTEQRYGDNNYYTDYSLIYTYDYKPFTAYGAENALPHYYSLNDIKGHELWSLGLSYSNILSLETDAAGYVQKIVTNDEYYGKVVYDFFYEDVPSGDSTPAESGNAGALAYDIAREDRSQYRDNGTLAFEHYYDCVVLQGNSQAVEKINAAIREDMEGFLYTMDDESLHIYTDPLPDSSYIFTTASAEVTDNSGKVFSICLWKRWCMGGVVTSNCHGLNFDARTGEPVNLPALYGMEEEDFLSLLKDTCWAYLSENHASDLWSESHDTVYGYSLSDFYCYFQDGELVVVFPAYSISYGAKGCITVPTGLYY